jgi:hypothetical protein
MKLRTPNNAQQWSRDIAVNCDVLLETRILSKLTELPIEHFNVIGECFVENLEDCVEMKRTLRQRGFSEEFPKGGDGVYVFPLPIKELILALH